MKRFTEKTNQNNPKQNKQKKSTPFNHKSIVVKTQIFSPNFFKILIGNASTTMIRSSQKYIFAISVSFFDVLQGTDVLKQNNENIGTVKFWINQIQPVAERALLTDSGAVSSC